MLAGRGWLLGGAVATIVSLGCGGKTHQVLDPARFDLRPYGTVALVTFTIENAKGSLHTLATERFAEAVLAAQPGIEVLEIGSADSAKARAPVVFMGHLKVSNVKPSASMAGLSVPRLEAKVTVELSVRLVSTASGGTLWRASSTITESIGHVGMSGGLPTFSASDPNEAYGDLVNYLVRQVTWDFRPTWRTVRS
jgi:hypothetical protein